MRFVRSIPTAVLMPQMTALMCEYRYTGNMGTTTTKRLSIWERTATNKVNIDVVEPAPHLGRRQPTAARPTSWTTPSIWTAPGTVLLGSVACGSEAHGSELHGLLIDDACMNLFTQGQADRMNALFAPGGERASLLDSEECACLLDSVARTKRPATTAPQPLRTMAHAST